MVGLNRNSLCAACWKDGSPGVDIKLIAQRPMVIVETARALQLAKCTPLYACGHIFVSTITSHVFASKFDTHTGGVILPARGTPGVATQSTTVRMMPAPKSEQAAAEN